MASQITNQIRNTRKSIILSRLLAIKCSKLERFFWHHYHIFINQQQINQCCWYFPFQKSDLETGDLFSSNLPALKFSFWAIQREGMSSILYGIFHGFLIFEISSDDLRRWLVIYLVIIKFIMPSVKISNIKIINSKDKFFQGSYLVQLYMLLLYMFPQHVGPESGCLHFISIPIVLMEAIAFLDVNLEILKNSRYLKD